MAGAAIIATRWAAGRVSRRAVVAVSAALLTGCSATTGDSDEAPTLLYVANALDGTLTQLDGERGRVVGPPLPGGPAPWQIEPGPNGSLVVLSMSPVHVAELTQVTRTRRGWATRPVPVGARSRSALLAGGGGAFAAVAYAPIRAGEAAAAAGDTAQLCQLDLVDLRAGAVVRHHAICAGRQEAATGLALEDGSGGPLAYVGLADVAGDGHVLAGRVLVLEPQTNAVLAETPLAGAPLHLTIAPAPGRIGRRVYAVEAAAGSEPGLPATDRAGLLELDPVTLHVAREHRLAFLPRALAVAPDGERAYGIASDGRRVMQIDLRSGAQRPLAVLPGGGASIAATAGHVYVPQLYGDTVWMLEGRRGELVKTIRVGRHPSTIALRSAYDVGWPLTVIPAR